MPSAGLEQWFTLLLQLVANTLVLSRGMAYPKSPARSNLMHSLLPHLALVVYPELSSLNIGSPQAQESINRIAYGPLRRIIAFSERQWHTTRGD